MACKTDTLAISVADIEPVSTMLRLAGELANAAEDALDALPADDRGDLADAVNGFVAAWKLAGLGSAPGPSPDHPSMRERTAGREPLG